MLILCPRRRRVRAATAATLLCLQACYAYVPVAAGVPLRSGERVRVHLTGEGTTELARYLGPNVVNADGALSQVRDDSTLVVLVDYVQFTNGTRQPWTGEGAVFFPAQYVRRVEGRQIQKRRSIVAGSLLALALVTTAILALRSAGAGGDGEIPPPPPP